MKRDDETVAWDGDVAHTSPLPDMCTTYERLQRRWRESLPLDHEVEFYLAHEQNCPSGIHQPRHRTRCITDTRRWLQQETQAYRAVGAGDRGIDVLAVLEAADALERRFDYRLPNGLHAGVHVNVASICRSEELLDGVAAALGIALAREQPNFDAVISTGSPMSMVARRMLRLMSLSRAVQHVPIHGYDRLTFLKPIRPGMRVVLLLDVVVTGTLIARVRTEVIRRGGTVVEALALVEAGVGPIRGQFHAMCTVAMDLADPATCPRCMQGMELADFNTRPFRMTRKSPTPRSPSQFLAGHPQAQEFWRLVDMAGAYAPHCDRDGRHYVAFVDTLLLLRHPVAGPCIVTALRERLMHGPGIPDAILAPSRRKRGRMLAEQLQLALRAEPGREVNLLLASGTAGSYRVPQGGLAGRRVLVVDAGVAHGDVLDELTLLATEAGASRVGAAVVLSRLGEVDEEALTHRLSGGFLCLFSLPIPPVEDGCVKCQRQALAKVLTALLPPGPLRNLARRAAALPKGGGPRLPDRPRRPEQVWLFPTTMPFAHCRQGVASGKVLNALYAAMGNGMPPLTLPELTDPSVPNVHRIAILDHLPSGVLDWSGPELPRELERALGVAMLEEGRSDFAGALLELLAREGRTTWLDLLEAALDRAAGPAHVTFGSLDTKLVAHAAFAVFLLGVEWPDRARQVAQQLLGLRDRHAASSIGALLREALADLDALLLAGVPIGSRAAGSWEGAGPAVR